MYHINSSSPFYQLNTVDNNARRSYYGINATPSSKCDGVLDVYPTTANLQSAYGQRTNIPSPLDIDLFITVDNMIHVEADITSESYFTGNNLYLRMALVAHELTISSLTYQYVLIGFAPTASGQVFNINPSSTVSLQADFTIPTITPLDNLGLVVFVQNDVTKEVMQSKYSMLPVDYSGLELSAFQLLDESGGNGNGLAEPGEECSLWVELHQESIFAPATGVTAILSTDDPDITIIDGEATFPDIGSGESGDNQDNPYIFQVSPDLQAHNVEFQLDISANGGVFSAREYFTFMVGIPDVFLVDDDGISTYEEEYIDTFEELDLSFDVWSVMSDGEPTGEFLSNYPKVIWFTAKQTSTLSENEQNAIEEYLDSGGKLFLSSENLGEDIGSTAFYSDYMHADPGESHVNITTLTGEVNDPISSGTTLTLYGGAYSPDSQSSIVPHDDARRIYKYQNTANAGALSYSWDYMLVYAAFPFECVDPDPVSFTPRDVVLANILEWFDSAITISLPEETAAPGEYLEAAISASAIDSEEPITSYEFEIQFNPEILELDQPMVTLENTITPSGWIPIVSSPSAGLISGVVFGATELSGEGELFKIRFHIIGETNDYSELTLNAFEFSYPLPIRPEDGGLTVGATGINDNDQLPVLPKEFGITSIYPNPFNPQTTIELAVREQGWVDLAVYNMLGERVVELQSGMLSAGYHRITFESGNLASGVYLLKAAANGKTATQKMVIMK